MSGGCGLGRRWCVMIGGGGFWWVVAMVGGGWWWLESTNMYICIYL